MPNKIFSFEKPDRPLETRARHYCVQSIFFVVIVIAIRFVLNRRNDCALICIDVDIEYFGSIDDFDVVDPAVF